MDDKKTKKESEDYKSKYLRALADYQNLEKRIREEREWIIKGANAGLLLRLLPFLDNLDSAEIFIKDKGLKIAKDNFLRVLKEAGLEEIQVLGKEFDPNTAEAIEIIPGEKDSIVAEVLKKGYKFNGKILRVAQVKVGKILNPKS